jgi:hypothetical protein
LAPENILFFPLISSFLVLHEEGRNYFPVLLYEIHGELWPIGYSLLDPNYFYEVQTCRIILAPLGGDCSTFGNGRFFLILVSLLVNCVRL